MADNMSDEFLRLAREHYWDTLEPHKELVLKHLESIAAMARLKTKRAVGGAKCITPHACPNYACPACDCSSQAGTPRP